MRWLDKHHRLRAHECEQTPGDSGGHRSPGSVLQSVGFLRVQQDVAIEQQQQYIVLV